MKTLSRLLTGAGLVTLALGAPLAGGAQAQEVASSAITAGHTLLNVNAQGSSTREPDMAVFTSGVTSQARTASAALADNSKAMTGVFAALKKAGIAEKDIQTSNLSVSPVYSQPARKPDGSYDANERTIVGYQVNNTVTVRQRKLDDFGAVIDALVSAGANEVNGPTFTLSQPDAAQDEARVEAIKEARRRADLYAKAAGLRVVRIVSIAEGGGYVPQIRAKSDMIRLSAASAPAPVAAGELDVTAQVAVQFELAP
ncbi:SIMPL domain-containing protein [Novosphingobium sp. 1949]|uniref:SIMPL domain-containing protein n=1 Tax=Novosphingobium organovorum TaxID=2930092 RepID=A0ABT0B944_9SPHN|nr:SIMPL domain-containing protein [Novosphingobium organovorum]MCJ2181366.1 SIMPL domain-containing protein [Novosphingobium organovorum]